MCSEVLLIPRVCNSAAHELASLGLNWDLGESCVWINPLSEFVTQLVAHDAVNSIGSMTRP